MPNTNVAPHIDQANNLEKKVDMMLKARQRLISGGEWYFSLRIPRAVVLEGRRYSRCWYPGGNLHLAYLVTARNCNPGATCGQLAPRREPPAPHRGEAASSRKVERALTSAPGGAVATSGAGPEGSVTSSNTGHTDVTKTTCFAPTR